MDDLHLSASNLSDNCDSHHLEQLSVAKEQHTCGISGVDTIHELGNILHETLQVKDENPGSGNDLPSNDYDSSGHEDERLIDGSTETSSRCLQKCATFPIVVGVEKIVPVMQLENKSHHRSLSLPTGHKLVSAMKGSREKEGVPLRKLSVSWAPDVYDPAPTSLSHYPKKKTQQKFRSNKKHGKGKQKGKSTRGGGSGPKDKKHYRKIGGKSDKCLDSYTDTDRVTSSNNYRSSSLELLDFTVDEHDEIGCSESNCGSSYLGKAGGTLHFAYAEAT